jgi:SNF2 family DNA or RNA helicase
MPLYPYQREGVKAIDQFRGRVLLADEMGLGKTIQALAWYRKRASRATPALVVCPASLKLNWRREAAQHIGVNARVLSGKNPQTIPRGTPLTIINYDILADWKEEILRYNPRLIIFDEAQYLKNRGAQRTQIALELSEQVKFVLALSGTPLTNRPSELWPIIRMVFPELYPSYIAFANEFCDRKLKVIRGRRYWDDSGAKNLHELHTLLKRHGMIRRLKKDVLTELPDKVISTIPLELPQYKKYQAACDDFIHWVRKNHGEERASRASKAQGITKVGYLLQLVADLKLKLIKEHLTMLLDDVEKVVVFTTHKKMVQELHGMFKTSSVVIEGETPAKKRDEYVRAFQTSKKIRVFIGNLRAAGVGLTLTAANTVVFAELGWTPGEHQQAADRCHRIGQKEVVNIHYLVAQNTIEEHLCELIQKKQKVLGTVLDRGETTDDLDIYTQLVERLFHERKASTGMHDLHHRRAPRS